MKLEYDTILNVVTAFYEKATRDFLIGYHFRKIEDFDTHIPRIASFWELQLTGHIGRREELPFKLLEVHAPLGIKRGELGRWVVLFKETLATFEKNGSILADTVTAWTNKVEFFEQRLGQRLIPPSER